MNKDVKAIYNWWLGMRPIKWNKAKHMENPYVNSCGKREQRLIAYLMKKIKKD